MKKLNFLVLFFLILCSLILNAQSKTVNVKTVNVRSEPNTSSEIVLKLNLGDEVVVINSSNGWDCIEVNNTKGYVFNKYLKEKKTISTPQKSTETYVLICNSSKAYAYHLYECGGLNRCKSGVSKVTISEAKAKGYRPCKICYNR